MAFEWLSDADMRFGPVLEAYINGRYYWVPMARLSCVKFEKPEDLRDQLGGQWQPGAVTVTSRDASVVLAMTTICSAGPSAT